MIPKTIHYCWFGGKPLPPLAVKCIDSWKHFCADYQIVEWNEQNFDIHCCKYVEEAYAAKKWAFVSDVARLYALVNHGGIYMDTDVQVLKPLDEFLHLEAFSGFECEDNVSTGIMAAEKGQKAFAEFLREYNTIHFRLENGSLDLTTNVERITKCLSQYGLKLDNTLQTVNGVTLYPLDYFCPKNHNTGKICLTDNTCTIHHFDGSWMPPKAKLIRKIEQYCGRDFLAFLVKVKRHLLGKSR